MNKRVRQLVDTLQLQPHPEGGYYTEIYRSDQVIPKISLPQEYPADRNVMTSIYYLLPAGEFSRFHRLSKSDELWYFHEGTGLTVHVIDQKGKYYAKKLGLNLEQGQRPQHVVIGGDWFAASVDDPQGYALVACVVAPGFDFDDFEIADRQTLLTQYPQHKDIISQLTH